mgnify:CR=1 FL=1
MSGGIRYTEEFKKDAVYQVTDRVHSVGDVSRRLGVSTKSMYDWIKLYSQPDRQRQEAADQSVEIRRLKAVRRHINWNNQRPDLKEDLAHLVDNIKRRICGIASAGFPSFSV